MDISKIECGKLNVNRQPSDVVSLTNLALFLNERNAESAGIKIDLSLEGRTFIAELDPLKIAQVLDNLVNNAIKFSPRGSTVEIKIGIKRNIVSISVRDEGAGISENQMKCLFQPFQESGRGAGPGTHGAGLGLTISQRIVEAHGGNIAVQSGPGKGSTFTINLPAKCNRQLKGKARSSQGSNQLAASRRAFAMSA
jgi:signal transduction histidine kinase